MTTDRSIETIGDLRRVEPPTARVACRAIAETRDDDDDDDDATTTTNRVLPSRPTDQGTNDDDDDDDASSPALSPIDPSSIGFEMMSSKASVVGGTVGDSWSS